MLQHKSQPNATFLLSLDCEGRWGWSDCLTDSRREALRDGPIEAAYEGVIRTLHEQTIAATFAFVGMFALDSSSINFHWKMIADHLWKLSPYTMAALQDIDAGRLDGWSGARVFGMVRSANDSHELAAHGFTHVPWTAPYVARSDLMKELELIQETWPAHGTAPQTFVYPRNQVAEVELLERKSFAGFRLGSQQRTRVSRLLMEFNLWSSPEYPHLQKRDIVEIPGGLFLNRRTGVRRLVPMQVTVTRWRRLIDKAIRTRGIVHLWTHPEDFIIGSDQLDLFSEVMEIISSARRSGDLIVQTQAEFCRIQRRGALDQTSTP